MNIRRTGLTLAVFAAVMVSSGLARAQDIQGRTIKFGHLDNADHPMSMGMQFNDMAPAELARMRSMVRPVYDKCAAEYEPGLVNTLKSELERIQRL